MFNALLGRSQKNVQTIKEVPFFAEKGLSENAMLEILNCMTVKQVPPVEAVVEYGDIGENFYLILYGEVEIFTLNG